MSDIVIINDLEPQVEATNEVPVRYNRFKDASWFPKKETYVLVGGCGGIGSWLVFLIERAGFYPTVFDFDTIEEYNLGGQLLLNKLGSLKVNALQELIVQTGGKEIDIMNEKYERGSMSNPITFSAFDNMRARKDMFERWVETNGTNEEAIYIDGRLRLEQMDIFCVKGGDQGHINEYVTKHLFNDTEVEDEICTLKQTSHTAAMIASFMVSFFTNWLNTRIGKFSDVPFHWFYHIPTNTVTVE